MQDLFSEFSKEEKKIERFPAIGKTQKPILLNTTLEQIILAGIVFILAACLFFFLGVLRGKALRQQVPAPSGIAQPVSTTGPIRRAVTAPTKALQPAAQTPGIIIDDAKKPYTIQLVTHRKKELAEREAAMIRRVGFFSLIIPSGPYFQVCAGQYATKEEAARDLRTFVAKYKDCFLRRRPA
ncbi:MAG: SPOR domain-containing protein [Candidatus Omnitrophica bacterium]|nr:SPOR domain-containing protein [Candidatus Omnitrophota bacterium]